MKGRDDRVNGSNRSPFEANGGDQEWLRFLNYMEREVRPKCKPQRETLAGGPFAWLQTLSGTSFGNKVGPLIVRFFLEQDYGPRVNAGHDFTFRSRKMELKTGTEHSTPGTFLFEQIRPQQDWDAVLCLGLCVESLVFYLLTRRSAEFFFGALVHQTIEDVHRWVLEGRPDYLDPEQIRGLFDFNYRQLVNRGIRPIGAKQREEAFAQVTNYVRQSKDDMHRVIETEVDVSVEKDDHILTGKVDLLLGGDGKLELLDFKSQPRPVEDDVRLDTYYKQLCIYAHILEHRYGKSPDRLLLYWTGEPRKRDALMVFPYRPDLVDEAGAHFDQVVGQILAGDFVVRAKPESRVCKECDIRLYCEAEGIGCGEQATPRRSSGRRVRARR